MSRGRWVLERAGRRVLELPASARPARVGRAPDNDIVLDGEAVPADAVELLVDERGRARVVASDGTSRELSSEETLVVGDYTLRHRPDRAPSVVETTRRLGQSRGRIAPLHLDLPEGTVELRPDGLSRLGRDPSNELVVVADVISSFHAELGVHEGQWRVRDLGSTNGTFLDGVRILEAALPTSGTLVFGNLTVPFRLRDAAQHEEAPFGLVGRSPAMQAVFRQIEIIAKLDEAVLVIGETGTGKELVATALHDASPRAARRFLARNCGGLAEGPADAELFGARKGAYTGAVDRPGVFEHAEGGTVFLDEVGELPLATQPKLLRALQEKRIQRLGALEEKAVDFRLVAATHRDLRKMVEEGSFREDLFHRIGVFTLRLPPLRERREDIPLIARHLLRSAGVELTERAEARLMAHDWPGNVRELRNCLTRASAFRTSDRIDVEDLDMDAPVRVPRAQPPPRGSETSPASSLARRFRRRSASLDDAEVRAETARAWEESGRSVSRSAQALGIAKSTMHRRKEVYRLPDPD